MTFGGVFRNDQYVEDGAPIWRHLTWKEPLGIAAHSSLALRVVGCHFKGALEMYRTYREIGNRLFEYDTSFLGSVSLSSSTFDEIIDNMPLRRNQPRSWPQRIRRVPRGGNPRRRRRVRCFVELDGLVYRRLGRRRDLGARARIRWLLLQPGEHLRRTFRPQPFEQSTNADCT